MELVNRELCAKCPNRGRISRLAAELVLGSDYIAVGCDGSVRVRQDNEHFSSRDGSIGGVISTVRYDCGNPEKGGNPEPEFISYNWDNGDLVSMTNHVTGKYTNFRKPEYSDPQV